MVILEFWRKGQVGDVTLGTGESYPLPITVSGKAQPIVLELLGRLGWKRLLPV